MKLDFLRALYEDPPGEFGGRYVSVYLDTTPTTAEAGTEVALRWQDARGRLAAAGADDATLDAVDRSATVLDHAVRGRVIFARGGATWLEGALPWPPQRELANLAPLPHVLPWLAQIPLQVPHVRVAATKVGGHVVAVSAVAAGEAVAETTIDGASWPVHKVSAGGWSEQRLQRSAEETWAATAKRIAAVTVAEAGRVRAQFVMVGGDVRERSMVLDQLPSALRESAVTMDREVDADDPEFEARAEAEERRRAALGGRALLDDLAVRLGGGADEPRGQGHRAVTGLAGTLTALREGLASDVLLVGEPSWVPEAVWVGPGLTDAATERSALIERGVADPLQGRTDAALVRAAAGTGAELHFIPADAADAPDTPLVTDGVAALLRAPASAL
jgi:Bacterial archaeo-eukaryotic release factor family 2